MASDIAHLYGVADKLLYDRKLGLEPEMQLRQGAARMYYVAYHVFAEALRGKLNRPTLRIEHEDLVQWLKTARNVELQKVGSLMEQASRFRKCCDYELYATISETKANDLVAQIQREIYRPRLEIRQLILQDQRNDIPRRR